MHELREECSNQPLAPFMKDEPYTVMTGWELSELNEPKPDVKRLKIEYYGKDVMHKLCFFPHLTDLDLSGLLDRTDIFSEHVAKIPALKSLALPRITVPEENLARLSTLTELRVLNMANTRNTWVGLPRLYDLKKIEEIDLSGTSVNDTVMRGLVDHFPNLRDLIFDKKNAAEETLTYCHSALADPQKDRTH